MAWFLYVIGTALAWRIQGALPYRVHPVVRFLMAAMWPGMAYPLWAIIGWIKEDRGAQKP